MVRRWFRYHFGIENFYVVGIKMSEEDWDLDNNSDSDIDTDTESDINDYQEGEEVEDLDKKEINSLFGDISDLDSDLDEPESVRSSIVSRQRLKTVPKSAMGKRNVRERQQNRRSIDQLKYNIPDFSSLDTEETYLPFSHVLSPYHEWKRVEDACFSGFRDVSELSKVRNKTIRLVADAAEYALQKNTALLPSLNKSFVVYAAQRGV